MVTFSLIARTTSIYEARAVLGFVVGVLEGINIFQRWVISRIPD
jgi:hypothetical protein